MILYNEFIQKVPVEYLIWGIYFVGVKFLILYSNLVIAKNNIFMSIPLY